MEEVSKQISHQMAYLIMMYDLKTVEDIRTRFPLSSFDFNLALWRAQDLNLFKIDDDKNIAMDKYVADTKDFSSAARHLINSVPYVLRKIAEDEGDMEEEMMMEWLQVYPPYDILVALKYLIDGKVIATYEIEDMEIVKNEEGVEEESSSVYTYFTLHENLGKRWGEKDFKEKNTLK